MVFVLDASVAVSWAFPDEQHAVADAALQRFHDEDGVVPALWWFEVRNALLAGERRNRIDPVRVDAALRRLVRLPITIDRAPEEHALFDLARRYKLTVYDSAYLELAQRRGLVLATLDRDLITAAGHVGVPLLAAEQKP